MKSSLNFSKNSLNSLVASSSWIKATVFCYVRILSMLLLFSFVLVVEELIYSSVDSGSASKGFSTDSFSFSKSAFSVGISSPLKLNYWLIALVMCRG